MIAFVTGDLAWRSDEEVVLLTSGGVGYRLAVSSQTLASMPAVGEKAELHAHLVSRDDSLALFGFGSEDERELFMMLLGVQGVGPKVALAVLGGGTTRELTAALASGDRAEGLLLDLTNAYEALVYVLAGPDGDREDFDDPLSDTTGPPPGADADPFAIDAEEVA